jgi:hypothetical protein
MTSRNSGKPATIVASARTRGRRVLRGLLAAVVLSGLAAAPAWALIMTPYDKYVNMSEEQQVEIVTTTVFEMIYYFNNVKHDPDKANCVGEYFSGSMDDTDGGYYHFRQRLDAMDEKYRNGTLGTGEESYVERVILKLIKEKCGV